MRLRCATPQLPRLMCPMRCGIALWCRILFVAVPIAQAFGMPYNATEGKARMAWGDKKNDKRANESPFNAGDPTMPWDISSSTKKTTFLRQTWSQRRLLNKRIAPPIPPSPFSLAILLVPISPCGPIIPLSKIRLLARPPAMRPHLLYRLRRRPRISKAWARGRPRAKPLRGPRASRPRLS